MKFHQFLISLIKIKILLKHGGHVDSGSGIDAVRIVALAEETMHTSDWKLKSSASRFGLTATLRCGVGGDFLATGLRHLLGFERVVEIEKLETENKNYRRKL